MGSEFHPAPAPVLEPSLLTAADLTKWRRRIGKLRPLPRLDGVILTHQATLTRALTRRIGGRVHHGLSAELRFLPGKAGNVAITSGLGVGAPATAIILEELAGSNVPAIISVDIGASLDPGLRSGAVVLVETAICGDGTSRHYCRSQSVAASPALFQRLADRLKDSRVEFTPGAVWSTDAPYRETQSEIDEFHGQGARLVDMETAALYAAGLALGVATASVLVVADELFDGWRPPADMEIIQVRLKELGRRAVECLVA